jgi:hypothetical protein
LQLLFEGECETRWLYEFYLAEKNKCLSHKLDWEQLLKKIKKDTQMSERDLVTGEMYFEEHKITGEWPGD